MYFMNTLDISHVLVADYDVVSAYTSGDGQWDHIWLTPSKDSISFSVKACQDARVALSRKPNSTENIKLEIRIGTDDNQQVAIL